MKTIAAFALVFALLFAPVSARADDASANPSKEDLLAAWEKSQKENLHTFKFEKTADKDVYDFETSIFPYKGKIHILNLLVEKNPSYNYDVETAEEDYNGFVELQLDGVDEAFTRKFPYSYRAWANGNILVYHAATKKWYTPDQWSAYNRDLRIAKLAENKSPPPTQIATEPTQAAEPTEEPTAFGVFLSWVPMLLMIGIWVGISKWQMRNHAKLQDRYTKLAEENHKLLSDILEVLKRKTC